MITICVFLGIVFLLVLVMFLLGFKANLCVNLAEKSIFFNVYIFNVFLLTTGRIFIDKSFIYAKIGEGNYKKLKLKISNNASQLPVINLSNCQIIYSVGDKDDAYSTFKNTAYASILLRILTANIVPFVNINDKKIVITPNFLGDINLLTVKIMIKIKMSNIILYLLRTLKSKATKKIKERNNAK